MGIKVQQQRFAEKESSEQGRDSPSAAPGTHSCQHLTGATPCHSNNTPGTPPGPHLPNLTSVCLSSPHTSPFLLPPYITLTGAAGTRWEGFSFCSTSDECRSSQRSPAAAAVVAAVWDCPRVTPKPGQGCSWGGSRAWVSAWCPGGCPACQVTAAEEITEKMWR